MHRQSTLVLTTFMDLLEKHIIIKRSTVWNHLIEGGLRFPKCENSTETSFSFVCSFVQTCSYVCECMYESVCACLRPEVNIGCLLYCPVPFESGSLSELELTSWLGWLTGQWALRIHPSLLQSWGCGHMLQLLCGPCGSRLWALDLWSNHSTHWATSLASHIFPFL